MAGETSSRASLEQEVYLRALTGRLVGIYEFQGFKKIAIISYPDRICESISAAAAVAYLDKYGYSENKINVFDYDNDINKTAEKITRENYDAVYIALGGEQKMSDVAKMFNSTLTALKNAGYKHALLIHVRTWLATKQLSTLDESSMEYIMSLPEVRLFTADPSAKKFFFHNVKFDGKKPKPEKYAEEDITQEHANLLKISLPPPE
ncbi:MULTISPECIES: hypothetical protein [Acidiplasma]|jgi:hypothetical protein|uniref:Uncharacterized protein n=1 Tax=Acidiplasma aeolicum TaxID=507754 RepID=A0A0P9CMD0_9ARCH|nr:MULTISPECIES: hypothetical protein [Acidiplasma]KJE48621.1 hypothetical protein TZ01_08190 [Acidiplasma sp. MBA-1]KPV46913.1 hypothetical protein SE19_03395 [Acidiplasma aeolicum]KQB35022.1 hypothetical protein AOG54_09260 [Acidiplasma aeolicum]WMT55369.1 MAG: hypothetical protein RE470_01690 [Acidiplasma sp.]